MTKFSDENNEQPPSAKKAVALKYDGINTPKIVAKGQGIIADDIVELAEANNVHVHYDPLLLEVLARLELDDEIPEILYLSVAKIIAFAYFLQGKHPNKKTAEPNETSPLLEYFNQQENSESLIYDPRSEHASSHTNEQE